MRSSSSSTGDTMVNCSDFLRQYSDYRDGLIEPARGAEMDAHLAGCAGCARYHRVIASGIGELRAIPEIEPSGDFLPRLQHRIFQLQDEASVWGRPETSGTSLGFVLLLVLLIGAVAWIPTMDRPAPLVQLAPVAAEAPESTPEVHALFRAGPLLNAPPAHSTLLVPTQPSTSTVFFRYTRLGGNSPFRTVSIAPR
jgi:anti-sigma factor RsiW